MTHGSRSLSSVAALCALSLFLCSSCEKKDSDKVAEAQACLDAATADTALLCMEKVSGVNTESANLIRCSANFIYQRFTDPTRLSKIADQMKTGSGASSAATAIGLLAFGRPTSAQALALMQETSSYCVASKSKGMILLSQMALIGTTLSNLVAGAALITTCDTSDPAYDATACKDAVKDAACDADSATLGNAALTAYGQSCQGSSQSNSSVCQQFATVTAGTTDPTTIGENLQTQLNDNTACP